MVCLIRASPGSSSVLPPALLTQLRLTPKTRPPQAAPPWVRLGVQLPCLVGAVFLYFQDVVEGSAVSASGLKTIACVASVDLLPALLYKQLFFFLPKCCFLCGCFFIEINQDGLA